MGATRNEREADEIDRVLFDLSARLERFAGQVGDAAVDDASRILFGLRGRVQKHMSKRALNAITFFAKDRPDV